MPKRIVPKQKRTARQAKVESARQCVVELNGSTRSFVSQKILRNHKFSPDALIILAREPLGLPLIEAMTPIGKRLGDCAGKDLERLAALYAEIAPQFDDREER